MKRAFKTIGILLSAIFLLAGCSSDNETLGEFDETTGEFIVAMQEKVPESQFMQKVVGHGWYEAELHDILESGKYDKKNILDNYVGAEPKYLFEDGTVMRYYYSMDISCDLYQICHLRYDESTGKVLINGNATYIILSLRDNEIKALKTLNIDDNGSNKTVYRYAILRKMTDEQLQKTQKDCWVRYEDIAREMTYADLCHKWVLINNDGVSVNPNIVSTYEQRSNDLHYIQFNPDGTVEGKSSTIRFKGTYEYTLGSLGEKSYVCPSLRIIPDKDGGEWPWIFKNFTEVNSGNVLYASYLYLFIDKSHTYGFIRGIEE